MRKDANVWGLPEGYLDFDEQGERSAPPVTPPAVRFLRIPQDRLSEVPHPDRSTG